MALRQRIKKRFDSDIRPPVEYINLRKEGVFLVLNRQGFSSLLILLGIFSWSVLLLLLATFLNGRLPHLLENSSTIIHNRFNASKALNILNRLSDIGPKVVGSVENEVSAIELITEEIQKIIKNSQPIHKIQFDLQTVSGSFHKNIFKREYYSNYLNIHNIVAKIGPHHITNNSSLLINCHFDSVATSAGSSDDGLNCAVMLEILNVLSKRKTPLEVDLIFLFNGAEEAMLVASHGFITQHPWAKDVKAFINLESCGAGGKEIMFQNGPGHAWLLKKYAESVPYPFGSVVASEIFESGLIPSDTDFRIFRDFGGIPGYDFAHFENGYVYHTKYDNVQVIHNVLGVLQHTGENILALALSLISSEEIHQVKKNEFQLNDNVYFDLWGITFIHYHLSAAFVINLTVSLISVFTAALTMSKIMKDQNYILNILEMLVKASLHLGVIIVAALYNFLIGYVLDQRGASMSWFTYSFWLIPIYVIPTIVIKIVSYTIIKKMERNSVLQAQSFCLSIQFVWSLLLCIGTFLGIRSSFIILIQLFPCTVTCAILLTTKSYARGYMWLLIYSLSSFLSSLHITSIGLLGFRMFLPITGRIGSGKNPEFIIALLATLITIMAFDFVLSLTVLSKQIIPALMFLSFCHLIGMVLVCATPLGFPYGASNRTPTPQRVLMQHLEIIEYNKMGNIEYKRGGFEIDCFDRQGFSHLPDFINERARIKEKNAPYAPFNEHIVWIDSSPPSIIQETTLELYSVESPSYQSKKLYFQVKGISNIILKITPLAGELISWSFDEKLPKFFNIEEKPKTYVVRHIQGLGIQSWLFWLIIEGKELKMEKEKLKIETRAFYIPDSRLYSSNYLKMLSNFKNWTHITPYVSSVKKYIF